MMNENEMLYCLIAFILGYLISRHMGNGFNVGMESCQSNGAACGPGMDGGGSGTRRCCQGLNCNPVADSAFGQCS